MATPTVSLVPDHAAIQRENAQHSTGPRTVEGKARVSLNACTHGMFSKTVVLPGEDRQHFEALGQSYADQYSPASDEERRLVDLLHATEWRLARLTALDINLHTFGTSDHLESIDARFGPIDDAARYALAQAASYVAHARIFDQLSRHEARLQRLCHRTRQILDRILADRTPAPQLPDIAKLAQLPLHLATQLKNGFVPPISTNGMPKFTGPLADIKRKQWLRRQVSLKTTK